MTAMITCKWCLEPYSKLAKAHIIPEAFFRNYSATGGRIYDANSFSKRSRIGWYDDTITCASCEKKLQSIDDKAVTTLLKDFLLTHFGSVRLQNYLNLRELILALMKTL